MSLKSAPSEQNAHVFAEFVPLVQPFRFYGKFHLNPYWHDHKTIEVKITFYFLGGIKSEIHLLEQLELVEKQIKQHRLVHKK